MAHSSKARRKGNDHTNDEAAKDPFFKKKNDGKNAHKQNGFFQAKLSVNEPGDKYEQEADSVANAVVNKTSQAPGVQQKKISSIQRLSTPMEDELLGTNDARILKDKEIQTKPMDSTADKAEEEKKKGVQKMDDPLKEEKKKKPGQVQKKQEGNSSPASPQLSSRIEGSAGKGSPLPKQTLKEMNSSFGADFSNVHIHNDSEAVNMNKELRAQAFTHGSDIYFNEGKFDTGSSAGKLLLAHELTHVVQQEAAGEEVQRQSTTTVPTVPGLGTAKTLQVSQLIQAGDRQGAVDVVAFYAGEGLGAKQYNIDSDLLENGQMTYDANVTWADASTAMPSWNYLSNPPKADPAKVRIGPSAFSSISYLYSVIMHEYQHVLYNQSLANQQKGNLNHGHGGNYTSEVEASAWELLHAAESGLDKEPGKIAQIWSSLNGEFWQLDGPTQNATMALAKKAQAEAKRIVSGTQVTLVPFHS